MRLSSSDSVRDSDGDSDDAIDDHRRRCNARNQTVPDMFMFVDMYDKKSTYHQKLTRSVIHFICKEALPVYTVEKEGFKSQFAFDPQ